MKVEITNDCIACGACCSINSDVFHCDGDIATVDQSSISGNEIDCLEASDACPVNAIKIEE